MTLKAATHTGEVTNPKKSRTTWRLVRN